MSGIRRGASPASSKLCGPIWSHDIHSQMAYYQETRAAGNTMELESFSTSQATIASNNRRTPFTPPEVLTHTKLIPPDLDPTPSLAGGIEWHLHSQDLEAHSQLLRCCTSHQISRPIGWIGWVGRMQKLVAPQRPCERQALISGADDAG